MEQRYNALSSLLLAEDSKRQRTDHMARETGVLQRGRVGRRSEGMH